jgi:membrane-associated protease RseP (regulator of RpoE activity)
VGKRYSFWFEIGLFEPTAGSDTMDIIDEQFAFRFYVLGKLGVKAGVQAKDIIVAIGEYQVTSLNELSRVLELYKGGETTTITVWRGGKEVVLNITLDPRKGT